MLFRSMAACASAHYWARCWLAAGREVRLINPRFVKPFVKGSKNDAVDAEAIFEAAMRPTMRFVPVKSRNQQDLQSLHRARDRLICQRTALINQRAASSPNMESCCHKARGALLRRHRPPSPVPISRTWRERSSANC